MEEVILCLDLTFWTNILYGFGPGILAGIGFFTLYDYIKKEYIDKRGKKK